MRRLRSGLRAVLRRRRRADPEARMTVFEHLSELRYRLVWVFGSTAVCGTVGWVQFDRIVDLLLRPARPFLQGPSGQYLVFTGPTDAFVLRLKVAGYVGFAIAFPVVLFHVWRFLVPGLHPNEKRYAIPFVISGMALFIVGVWFAFITLPQALRFLIGPAISGEFVRPLLTGRQFMDFMLLYLLAFGLCFEFPLVLMFLTIARVITSRQMARYRRHVVLAITVLVAVATPSVDLYSMVVLTVALYVLYESCIWLSRLLRR